MSSAFDQVPGADKLYVGEGVVIKGAQVVSSTVIVEGVLEGDITVDNLIVSPTGAVSGRIFVAKNADISGKVFEKLDVKGLLILRATGRVDGSVSFGTLTIERGACVTGEVSSTDYGANRQSSYRASPAAAKPAPQQDAVPASPASTPSRLELSTVDLIPDSVSATA